MGMTTRKERAILEVSVLWRTAAEYCSDEVYDEVKKLMELAILAEDDKAFVQLADKLSSVEAMISLEINNTERAMLYHWERRNQKEDDS